VAVHDSAFGSGTSRENEIFQVLVDIADQFFVSHLIYDVRLVSEGQSVTQVDMEMLRTRLKEVMNTLGRFRPSAATMSSCTLGRYVCQWFLHALVSHNIIIRE
jgi:hypothetical protein